MFRLDDSSPFQSLQMFNFAVLFQALTSLVKSLPDVNKVVLEKLTAHLSRVASFADTNLMTIANLG